MYSGSLSGSGSNATRIMSAAKHLFIEQREVPRDLKRPAEHVLDPRVQNGANGDVGAVARTTLQPVVGNLAGTGAGLPLLTCRPVPIELPAHAGGAGSEGYEAWRPALWRDGKLGATSTSVCVHATLRTASRLGPRRLSSPASPLDRRCEERRHGRMSSALQSAHTQLVARR